jgi:hypothetical protein
MQWKYTLILIGGLVIFMCLAGCTNSTTIPTAASTSVPTQFATPAPAVTTAQPITVTTTTATTIVPTTIVVTPNANSAITIQPTTTIDVTNYTYNVTDPRITKLTFSNYEYTGSNGQLTPWIVSDCNMAEIFPDIVNNPNYGFNASFSNLTGISPAQFNVIYREYIEGANQNSQSIGTEQCYGSTVYHQWTFYEISALISPTNFNPADYEIVIVPQGYDKDLAYINVTQQLSSANPNVELDSYIPIRVDQSQHIDDAVLRFYKLD